MIHASGGSTCSDHALRRDRIVVVALWLVFAGIVIKAASADMTWDEAWTYLFYGRSPLGFTILDYANDHPVNSFLIWACTRLFGNSELVIRLPNVLAGGLYLATCLRLIRHVRLPALAFGLCVMQPYLWDYFALARGYGIAAALVQFGLVAHFFGGRPRPLLMLSACLLASLTVFSTLVVLYALIGSLLVTAGVSLGGAAVFGVLGLVPVAGLHWVSREGLPLYGSEAGFFGAIVRGVAHMYVVPARGDVVAVVMTVAVVALAVLGARRFGPRAVALLIASGLSLLAVWAAARVLGKPLPTGRVLIPFLPLWTLTVLAMAEDVATITVRAVSVGLCAVLTVVFLQRLQFQRYSDWPEDYHLRDRLVRALALGRGCIPEDVWGRYGKVYYMDRWFPPGEPRPPDGKCAGK